MSFGFEVLDWRRLVERYSVEFKRNPESTLQDSEERKKATKGLVGALATCEEGKVKEATHLQRFEKEKVPRGQDGDKIKLVEVNRLVARTFATPPCLLPERLRVQSFDETNCKVRVLIQYSIY